MSTVETRYELKLADGRVVTWLGRGWEDAASRYVDCHRTAVVVAWREPRIQIRVGPPTEG
jgi:hypothetical protein